MFQFNQILRNVQQSYKPRFDMLRKKVLLMPASLEKSKVLSESSIQWSQNDFDAAIKTLKDFLE